ncbi:DoxX family protein [Enterovirga aerilata]|uniref:DoxX family protein n=1 Tax=Enterovirga aerilata TaxID=2730920 RepID=A0A849IC98_9HYPH|nr:DoxX family protein [Enterovirga sp. DB1703]NNM71553.1 DoxX family protein [Enterovirga sp. DB1703]
MPQAIQTLLSHRALALAARIILTFPFWGSGLDKLINFSAGVADMRQFGLEPAILFNVAVLVTQLVGAGLIIAGRHVWLGAGALGIFTALTIPIVHHFWTMQGPAALHAFHTAAEHIGMIGGLITVSILSARTRPAATGIAMPQVVPAR